MHWDPYHVPIIIEETGKVALIHLIEGITLSRQKRGGTEEFTVMEHREDLSPQIVIRDDNDEVIASHPLPAGAFLMTREGARVTPGMTVARVPRQSAKNKDITGGLPRIAELFEARQPREVAEIARIDGFVQINAKNAKGRRQILIEDREAKTVEEHGNIPANKHLTVSNGDYVHKGDKLTEGSVVPHALLEICGPHELQRFLVNEIQLVYRAQGVEINDKHVEIIIRQMMQKIRITDPGDTDYLVGEPIDRVRFEADNRKVAERGGRPAEGEPILLGITKASLETDSFISAASFQDTTRILTEAATLGKTDDLKGFKENVITGHLIPAGTGTEVLQSIRLKYYGEEIPRELPELPELDEDELPAEELVADESETAAMESMSVDHDAADDADELDESNA
ncbi:DNA-directed RNA polymerase subunit beta' [bioreactor metagenome]|uniref:DNA-directed RNA polymerase subunit beta n=1 Tax=bioreactor metagenome TaxID=1076179 RepID=A0A645D571_9ZZZZ